ncbi:hypothetical protein IJ162_00385 [Candidatus Saccharibacteria bacterium]|nr:hypothetical protein [Candidatus Saccharibacteria bacterium]
MIEKSEENENEIVRLTIQIGIVASCLAVISSDYDTLDPNFQLAIKFFALLLGLMSMAYIALTGRKYGFNNKNDFKIRRWFYDSSITLYWNIFFTMVYLFSSNLITNSFGISLAQIYVATAVFVFILTIIILFYRIIMLRH